MSSESVETSVKKIKIKKKLSKMESKFRFIMFYLHAKTSTGS